jgi:uncharacterized oxidoreductase
MEVLMRISGNTILITGGATGIGLALAESFLRKGNKVIICGRRKDRLAQATDKFSQLQFITCDVADPADRERLYNWVKENHKDFNILINNAGIQKEINLKKGTSDLQGEENEIDINLKAPVHLAAMFVPHLMAQKEAAIVNISSGLGFIPIAFMPVYCATKAALHSFSLSLRHQLKDTSIKIFEIIPPTVDTELDRGARQKRGQTDRGIKPEIVAEAAIEAMEKDDYEAAVGQAQFLRSSSRTEPERVFQMINGR